MDLSIVIVNYNGGRFLQACLDSVFASQTESQYEVIVVDNHSTDDSVAVIKASTYPVTLVENSDNIGFSAANNQGVRLARGSLLFFLNNDTVVRADAIDRLITYLKAHPKTGIVGPQLRNGDGTVQGSGGLLSRWRYHTETPRSVSFVSGAAMLMKKALFESVGGFDEHYFFYNEDLDLCRTVIQAGYQIIYYPAAQVVHFGGLSTAGRRPQSMVEGLRGGLYFCRKFYGPLVYTIYKTLLLVYIVPMWIWHRLAGLFLTSHHEWAKAYKTVMACILKDSIYSPYLISQNK
ncbi:MAG: glycosyltransferase family 2 protein [Candidatus Margulisiibacteriota bacterium]